MDSLPDELLRPILALLPLVDAFRLRRVSERFDRLLLPPKNLILDDVEIAFQLAERAISTREFKAIVGDILASCYVEFVYNLKLVCFSNSVYIFSSMVAVYCPNVAEVTLRQGTPISPFEPSCNLCSFPFSCLRELPNLKKLTARLSLFSLLKSDAPAVFGRLQEMEEVSSVECRHEDRWFWNYGNLALSCVKEICFVGGFGCFANLSTGNHNYLSRFSNLESVVLRDAAFIPAASVFPETLIRLSLGNVGSAHFGVLPPIDMSVFKCLPNLTEINLNRIHLQSYEFLAVCGKLQSISICECLPKFNHQTFCIPRDAPLRHINFGRSLNISLLEVLRSRNYHLTSVCIDGTETPDHLSTLFAFLWQNSSTLRSVQLRCGRLCDEYLERFGDVRAFPVLSEIWDYCSLKTVDVIRRLLEMRCTGWDVEHTGELLERGVVPPFRQQPLAPGVELTLMRLVVDKELIEGCLGLEQLAVKAKVVLMNSDGELL